MKMRTFLILLAIELVSLAMGVLVPRRIAAQTTNSTTARQALSANITGYAMYQSAASAFQGCLATDTGCTMEVIVCYAPNGASTPSGCIPLPAGQYNTAVYFERSGGTEVPNGTLSGAVAYAGVQVAVQ